MDPADAETYIADTVKNNNINHMTLIGGEALLDVDRTVAIAKIAFQHGIPSVDVSTNASWAVDEDRSNPTARSRRVPDAQGRVRRQMPYLPRNPHVSAPAIARTTGAGELLS